MEFTHWKCWDYHQESISVVDRLADWKGKHMRQDYISGLVNFRGVYRTVYPNACLLEDWTREAHKLVDFSSSSLGGPFSSTETIQELMSNMSIRLVVWNIFYFFHILGIIIPTDFHIFHRGRYTTNQWCINKTQVFPCFHIVCVMTMGWPVDRHTLAMLCISGSK